MYKRIPRDNAYKLIARASREYSKNSGTLRFGQCLWNLMHQDYPDLANRFVGTDNDFYYTLSSVEAASMFWTCYVEI